MFIKVQKGIDWFYAETVFVSRSSSNLLFLSFLLIHTILKILLYSSYIYFFFVLLSLIY